MDTTNRQRKKERTYTTDAGPIDLDKLAQQALEDLYLREERWYDCAATSDKDVILMYLKAAYEYGKNNAWWEEQENTRRQWDDL